MQEGRHLVSGDRYPQQRALHDVPGGVVADRHPQGTRQGVQRPEQHPTGQGHRYASPHGGTGICHVHEPEHQPGSDDRCPRTEHLLHQTVADPAVQQFLTDSRAGPRPQDGHGNGSQVRLLHDTPPVPTGQRDDTAADKKGGRTAGQANHQSPGPVRSELMDVATSLQKADDQKIRATQRHYLYERSGNGKDRL